MKPMGPGGAFAFKLFVLGLVAVILTITAALLMRGLHWWLTQAWLKKTIFTLLLFIVFAVLVFAGEAILQWPEAGALLTIFVVLILTKAYESGKISRRNELSSRKAEREAVNLKEAPVLLICAFVVAPYALAFGAYCVGYCRLTAVVVLLSSTMAIFAAIVFYAAIKSNK